MSEIDLPARLARYEGNATIQRIALREEDVAPGTKLPSFDAASKSSDPRHRWFADSFGDRCWELDAMSPVVLRQRVEVQIYRHLDVDAWTHAVAVEAAEVDSMRSFLAEWNSKSGQASKYSGDTQ